jgi:hypothetical protein
MDRNAHACIKYIDAKVVARVEYATAWASKAYAMK